MKRYLYALNRFLVGLLARPSTSSEHNIPTDCIPVYVLQRRSLTDLIVLDIASDSISAPSPLSAIEFAGVSEATRFFPLMRASGGRITMRSQSPRMSRLLQASDEFKAQTVLVPVSVFWGRSMSGDGSWLKLLTSEHWAVTGRLKRLINLVINRRNILVHYGRPIPLVDFCQDDDPAIAARRLARLLRVRLRQQKERTLGPDFSHRRTLIAQVVDSQNVQDAIAGEVQAGRKERRVKRQAAKYARTIASDMSAPTIRVLARLLSWFWNRIYNGIDMRGIEHLSEFADTHTLVYVPCHRSHLDYLLLSYLLYYQGLMIPHIAAGDNLNLPIVGQILRRGGAFFMRRSFRDDPLYVAVFEEYLYRVYRRGHCVEFFPEGGRSRTGRLLPAKFGLLKMTLAANTRGLPKPLAFVPVYLSYEKLVEGRSYLSELRGADKKKESVFDLLRNFKLIRQNFGEVVVNVGNPLALDPWLEEHGELPEDQQVKFLAEEIMVQINQYAYLNPINLVALTTLAMPNQAIEESLLVRQIRCYQSLITSNADTSGIACTTATAEEIIAYTESLKLLGREEHSFGAVLGHEPDAAVLMTWYRNNVLHALALPSLIACLLVRRRRSMTLDRLQSVVEQIYPYLARELSTSEQTGDLARVLDVLGELDLLQIEDEAVTAPHSGTVAHQQLLLLAHLVSQTLERMYIVIYQLGQEAVDRETLQRNSRLVAQKISRLYGINAPEFSDERLFNLFIDELIERRAISMTAEGVLSNNPVVTDVLRAAEHVIEPQVRLGVVSATAAQV